MALIKNSDWNERDIFFYYDSEEYFLRYEYKSCSFFLKSLWEDSEYKKPHDNRLVNDIIRFWKEISKKEYFCN